MGQEKAEESRSITIPKDEPETQTPVPVQETSTEPTEPVEEKVRSELEKYPYSLEDLNKMYGNLRTLASEADMVPNSTAQITVKMIYLMICLLDNG